MKHLTSVRMESRVGMRQPEFRVTCTCGWEEKALTEQEAAGRGKHHEEVSNV
jgi:hypothetical protein